MEGESRKKERKRREVDERGIVTYHYHRKAFVRFTIIDHGRDGKKSKERRETGRRDGTIEKEREKERIVTLRKINPPSLLASLSLLRHRSVLRRLPARMFCNNNTAVHTNAHTNNQAG